MAAPAERPSEEFHLSWKAKPSRRRAPSGTNHRPRAGGRNNFFGHSTSLPSRSMPAVAPPPRDAAGTASTGEAPLAPAAPRAPLPSAPCPGRGSRGAAPASPQRPQLPASPFLLFPFRNSPLGQSCVAQPQSKAAENAEIAVLLTAQQCPDRRAPGSFPSPPRHVGSSGGRRQSGPGSPGRPQGGGRAGFCPPLSFRLCQAAACCTGAASLHC